MSLAPYMLPLSAGSSLWMYEPARDAAAAQGWNASYSGSTVWPPGGGPDIGDGSQFFRTQNAGASVGIDFTGTGLLLCFRDNGAAHTLNVNGRRIDTQAGDNDATCRELGATTTLRTGDLDFALHSVVLEVNASDDSEFEFYGGILQTRVAVDRDGDVATEVTIDDRDKNWVMEREGSYKWDVFEDPRAINGTGSFVCPYGSSITAAYKFKGASAIVFYGKPGRDTHDFSIILDQTVFSSDASASGWALPTTVSFLQTSLDADHEYTLTYRNYADAKPNCTRAVPEGRYCCSTIDGFKLLGPASKLAYLLPLGSGTSGSLSSTSGAPSPISPSGSHDAGQKTTRSNNTAAIAGGVVGGVVVAAIIIAVAFFVLRRRRRQESYRTQFPDASSMQASVSQRPTSSVMHGTVRSDVAHPTISPFTYSPPTSSHTPSVVSPVTIMSGGPVIGKRPAPPSHVSSSGSAAASSRQFDRPIDLVAHAGDTLPPAYTRG